MCLACAASLLLQALLLALPCRDGYLARQQEGELKYMLAFASPARALEWALLLQVGGRRCLVVKQISGWREERQAAQAAAIRFSGA